MKSPEVEGGAGLDDIKSLNHGSNNPVGDIERRVQDQVDAIFQDVEKAEKERSMQDLLKILSDIQAKITEGTLEYNRVILGAIAQIRRSVIKLAQQQGNFLMAADQWSLIFEDAWKLGLNIDDKELIRDAYKASYRGVIALILAGEFDEADSKLRDDRLLASGDRDIAEFVARDPALKCFRNLAYGASYFSTGQWGLAETQLREAIKSANDCLPQLSEEEKALVWNNTAWGLLEIKGADFDNEEGLLDELKQSLENIDDPDRKKMFSINLLALQLKYVADQLLLDPDNEDLLEEGFALGDQLLDKILNEETAYSFDAMKEIEEKLRNYEKMPTSLPLGYVPKVFHAISQFSSLAKRPERLPVVEQCYRIVSQCVEARKSENKVNTQDEIHYNLLTAIQYLWVRLSILKDGDNPKDSIEAIKKEIADIDSAVKEVPTNLIYQYHLQRVHAFAELLSDQKELAAIIMQLNLGLAQAIMNVDLQFGSGEIVSSWLGEIIQSDARYFGIVEKGNVLRPFAVSNPAKS